MKLTASKTETMKFFKPRTMHPLSPPLTIEGTELNESDDIDILTISSSDELKKETAALRVDHHL